MTEAGIEAESLRARLSQLEQEQDFLAFLQFASSNERTCGVAAFFCDRADRRLRRPGVPS